MNSKYRLFNFNMSFDLELGGINSAQYASITDAMSAYALLCCRPGDAAVCSTALSESYLSFLREYGFSPVIADKADDYREHEAVPWGWSVSSTESFCAYGLYPEHPSYDAVRRANSRELSSIVARELAVPSAGLTARTAEELQRIGADAHRFPLVIKPCYGSAGSGFIRVNAAEELLSAIHKAERFFSIGIPVSVEPWLDRLDDYAANFMVDHGGVSSLSIHRSRVDSNGVFRGIDMHEASFLSPEDDALLRRACELSAAALSAEGYFGPAGIDAFSFRDAGTVKFNALCEINARLTMGYVARALRSVLGGPCSRMILAGVRRRSLPAESRDIMHLLGEHAYCLSSSRGIFPASAPVSFRSGEAMPASKMLFYIAAESFDVCDAYEKHLRDLLAGLPFR